MEHSGGGRQATVIQTKSRNDPLDRGCSQSCYLSGNFLPLNMPSQSFHSQVKPWFLVILVHISLQNQCSDQPWHTRNSESGKIKEKG